MGRHGLEAEDRGARGGPSLPRGLWLPFAAWAVFLALAFAARLLGAGVFATALVALVPFGFAGGLLRRTGSAVALSLLLGLAILALLPGLLDGLGLKPGATAGAAIVGALALPLGSGVGHHRRLSSARPTPRPRPAQVPVATAAVAVPAKPTAAAVKPAVKPAVKASAAKPPGNPVAAGGDDARRRRA